MADVPVPGSELSDEATVGAAIPPPVHELMAALWGGGYAAYVVGGSLRDVLLAREALGSTGIGGGIAIPHGRLATMEKPIGLFARLAHPVDFDAIDERPVDIVFLLVTPEGAGADHLKALARVSRLLRDRSLVDKLRATENAEALYALLVESVQAQPAA